MYIVFGRDEICDVEYFGKGETLNDAVNDLNDNSEETAVITEIYRGVKLDFDYIKILRVKE